MTPKLLTDKNKAAVARWGVKEILKSPKGMLLND